MAISVLLKINGNDYTGNILTPFEVQKNKLWAEDTGRVMSGKMVGTFIGVFPKLVVQFQFENEVTQSNLLTLLDTAFQTVQYYEPKTRGLVTMGTYSNDYRVNIINLSPMYGEVTVSFISTEKE